jgi:uncharacterized protein YndB with AHSA1/START domain
LAASSFLEGFCNTRGNHRRRQEQIGYLPKNVRSLACESGLRNPAQTHAGLSAEHLPRWQTRGDVANRQALHSRSRLKEDKSIMDKIIHLSAGLQCTPQRAFELFTVNQLLETWLVAVAEVEPTVAGKYELFWEPDDRENNSTLGCKVTAVEPGRFIAFEWRSPKQYKHFANSADPLTHVVVFFTPGHEKTEVHLIHSGWRSSPEWEEARQWQIRAWQIAFQELEKQVNDQHA